MPDLSKTDKHKSGVHYAYPAPVNEPKAENDTQSKQTNDELKTVPLEDLMSKLKNL